MRWSVLLPTHNRPDTLALSIGSVLAQSEEDWELLVVGDGCTPETAKVVASFADARIRWFDLSKAPGLGYANRRTVLEQASGSYLALASHDDLWAPGHLGTLGELLDNGAALAYSKPIWATPSGHLVPLPFDLADPMLRERFAIANYVPSTFVAATMSAVTAAGGWPVDVDLAADWHLMRRILDLPDARAGYSSDVTALFFRSIRRDADHFSVNAILLDERLDDWWPAAARVQAEPGSTLQAVVARADSRWWSRLDAAARQIEGHLAFAATELTVRAGELQVQAAVARVATEQLRSAYVGSTSWRLTAPLRALGAAFTKRG